MATRVGAFLLVVLVISGCASPIQTGSKAASRIQGMPPAVPPVTVEGVLEVQRSLYDFGVLVFTDSRGAPYPTAVRGSVHHPISGPGPYPLILFMHGRHGTCKVTQFETLGPVVCPNAPPVLTPVENFRGYDYIAQPLASHGYVVVSIDANNLNDLDLSMGDQGAVGRAKLIARTLDDFKRLNESAPGPGQPRGLQGLIDFSRIGLMGHSRGGEGVTRFISYNEQRTDGPRYALQAVFALAPTDFARWKVANVTHLSLLPYCDGDVSNLQGAWMYDDARYLSEAVPRPKIQILAMGSNHNNYNTIWTGDDAGGYNLDGHCGPSNPPTTEPGRRMSPEDQRRHGRVYIEAFMRHYVGGEPGFSPLFTGAAPPPGEACPTGWARCDDYLHVSYHAPAPQRLVIEDTLDADTLSTNDLGGTSSLIGFVSPRVCVPPQCPPMSGTSSRNYARAPQLVLTWDSPARWTLQIPEGSRNVTRFDVLSFRAVVDYTATQGSSAASQDLTVMLRDASGRVATVRAGDHTDALFISKGGSARRAVPNEVRLPLSAFSGIDLTQVAGLDLSFDIFRTGSVLVTDVMLRDEPDPKS